jgi:hypothetical protein
MKILILLVTGILALSSPAFSQASLASHVTKAPPVNAAKKFQQMVGNWEIVGEQESGAGLEIIDSNTIIIRFMGEEKKLAEYRFDFSKSPHWFDFAAKDSSELSSFKSLIEFVNDDMIKWQVFTDGSRSSHFTQKAGELFYLRRANSKTNAATYTDAR